MRIVIVGARNRRPSEVDNKLINDIVDRCKQKYSHVVFVVASCDKGVGQILKERNRKYREDHNEYEYNCLMLELHHNLVTELSQSEFTSHWMAMNNTLVDLGDEFHLLTDDFMKGGTMYDLVQKIKELGRPCALYTPAEASKGVKAAERLI